jgi:hypothetical protein
VPPYTGANSLAGEFDLSIENCGPRMSVWRRERRALYLGAPGCKVDRPKPLAMNLPVDARIERASRASRVPSKTIRFGNGAGIDPVSARGFPTLAATHTRWSWPTPLGWFQLEP